MKLNRAEKRAALTRRVFKTYKRPHGIYYGDFIEAINKPDGNGTTEHMYKDGFVFKIYVGEYKAGLRNGFGTMTYTNENSTYTGQWKDDKMHGIGKHVMAEFVYEGEYQLGVKHGKGKIVYGNNTVSAGWSYEGDFFIENRRGRGREWHEDGAEYEGDFDYDMRFGNGTFKFADGKVYTGEWWCDIMYGNGTMTFPSGTVAEGHFHHDYLPVNGTIRYPNGDVYTGETFRNLYNGTGTMKWANGSEYSGAWLRNEPLIPGTLIYALWEYDRKNLDV